MADVKRSLAATLLVASALTGCGRRDEGWDSNVPTRYCVDQSGHRVADEQCARTASNGGGSAFLWYYLGSLSRQRSNYVPPLGGMAQGGGFAPGAGVSYVAAPSSPSSDAPGFRSVARGGFGGTGRGIGAGE